MHIDMFKKRLTLQKLKNLFFFNIFENKTPCEEMF